MSVMTATRKKRKREMSWNEFTYGWLQLFILLSIWGIDGIN